MSIADTRWEARHGKFCSTRRIRRRRTSAVKVQQDRAGHGRRLRRTQLHGTTLREVREIRSAGQNHTRWSRTSHLVCTTPVRAVATRALPMSLSVSNCVLDGTRSGVATSARLTGILGQTSVSTPGFSENATRAAEPPLRPNTSPVNQPGTGDGPVAPGALSPPRPPATPAQAPAPPSATTV